jgi:hypothetical protein
LGFALKKAWETLTMTIMLSLHTITAIVLVFCTKVDLVNQLALVVLEQGRRWNAWLIWRAASCRGGRKEAELQSAQSPPE